MNVHFDKEILNFKDAFLINKLHFQAARIFGKAFL